MGTCVVTVDFKTLEQGGLIFAGGTATLSSEYDTAGETLNLSNVFKSASSPKVLLSNQDGYVVEHNHGTAAAGKVLAYCAGAGAGAVLASANASADLSGVNITWMAIGQAY